MNRKPSHSSMKVLTKIFTLNRRGENFVQINSNQSGESHKIKPKNHKTSLVDVKKEEKFSDHRVNSTT